MAKKQKSFLESYQSFKNKRQGKPENQAKKEHESANKFLGKDGGRDKVNQYNTARKTMGLSEDKNVTQKKYDSYFGTTSNGDKGVFGRYQEYQNKFKQKNKPSSSKEEGSSFDEKVDKGLTLLSKTFNKIKSKVGDATDNKGAQNYLKGLKNTTKVITHIPGIKEKISGFKAGLKAMEVEDRYIASPARNIIRSAQDKKLDLKKDVTDAISNKRRTSGEEIFKKTGLTDSKYLNKLGGFGVEAVADPINLVGAGAYKAGAKAIKGASKLENLAKTSKEFTAAYKEPVKAEQLLLDAPKPGAKFENAKVIEPKLQQAIEKLPKKEQKALNIDQLPKRPKGSKVSNRRVPNGVLMAEGLMEKPKNVAPTPSQTKAIVKGQLDPTTAPLVRADNPTPKGKLDPTTAPMTKIDDVKPSDPVELTHLEKVKQRSSDLVSNLGSKWKNRSKFKIYRETQDRNFDKIFGEDSQLMKDTYLEPIKQKEAERVKFIRNLKTETDSLYKNFKISKKDDALIQKFGEGKITIDELKKETKNWANVEKAVEPYRKIYKDAITNLNAALTRNGFDPIPERENYFPHFNDEGGILKDVFGIDKTKHSLPTDINGLTDQFRPQKSFFGNALRRKGDETSFGALQGLSQYIEGASSLIYHTDNIRNIRSLEDSIREQFAGTEHLNDVASYFREYADQLAGKKGKLDRGAEELLGRGVYNTAKTLQGNIGKAMTSFNVGSALTGFIPSVFGAAQTSKKALSKALFETLQNTVKNDGFTEQSAFLTRRIGADPLYMTKWDKVADKGYWMMKQIDNFNSQLIVRGKYNELIDKGMKHDEAIKLADDFGAKVMADRSKGQTPLLFNQKVLGPLTQFQIEVNNQISHIMKDMPKNALSKSNNKGMQALHLGAAFGQLALYGWAFNELFEKVTGRRPAFDPVDYARTFKKSLDGDAKATELVKSLAGQLPFTSAFVQGRTPLDAAIPSVPEMLEEAQFMGDGSWSSIKEEGLKQAPKLPFLFMPGYSQFNKTKDAYKALNEETPGIYTDSGKLKYLVDDDTPNKLKGLIFGKGAFRETNEYYDKNRKPLSDKQTSTVVSSPDPKSAYNQVHIGKLERKLKTLEKQPIKENKEQMKKLMEQLKKMKGE